jgi:hypothetical protein
MANTTGICEKIHCPNGFYFGDQCYALDEKLYEAWIEWGRERERTEGRWCNDGKFCHEGKEIMCVDSTAYGDGCYHGLHMVYGVDAGCLALIPLEFCNREGFETLGLVVRDFSGVATFETNGDCGSFYIEWGPVDCESVETGESEEEPEDEDPYEDDSVYGRDDNR